MLKFLSPFNGRKNKSEICLDNSSSYSVEEEGSFSHSFSSLGGVHIV